MALEDLVFGAMMAALSAIIAILVIWRWVIERPMLDPLTPEFKEYLRRKAREEHPGDYVSSPEFKKYLRRKEEEKRSTQSADG